MTPPVFALCITCVLLGTTAQTTNQEDSSTVHQQHRFISGHSGDNLTLHCFYDRSTKAWLYWFKETLGQKPRLISTFYDKIVSLSDEFKSNPRFTFSITHDRNHLTITDVQISDSATYFCVRQQAFKIEFAEAITVIVKDSAVTDSALVLQSTSGSIQSGDSVTLNCTVYTGTCDGEHSVYWFKDSEESHPGLIYTHGGRNDQCERKDNTQTHTCVYNLPLKDLDVSHAGTYYCAVASCGHILFGSGTKLDFKDEVNSGVLVHLLSGALAFTTILVIILVFTVFEMSKKDVSQPDSQVCEDTDNLHYAALSVSAPNRSRRQRNNLKNECVYSSVKL